MSPSGPSILPLPDGWNAAVDPASGRTYFFTSEGETRWELPTKSQRDWSLPIGQGVLVHLASVLLRLALLSRANAATLCMCGVCEDWCAAAGFTLIVWPLPLLLRVAITLAALCQLALDFGLQVNAGVRLHSSTWRFVTVQLVRDAQLHEASVIRNSAMVSASTWVALACLVPAAALTRHEPRWRPHVSPRGWMALSLMTVLALWTGPLCCGASSVCSANAELAQQPNALAVLYADLRTELGWGTLYLATSDAELPFDVPAISATHRSQLTERT